MRKKEFYIIFVIFSLFFSNLEAQIQGYVLDSKGDTLSFATVYIKNSTKGTTTNEDGWYFLNVEDGKNEIVFQYVGYKTQIHEVNYTGQKIRKDISLEEENVGLQEVTVTAEGEDPAYAIIRKAIAKREYYASLVEEYACDVYMKGNQKLKDVPEKIMGMELGDLEGMIDDSTRQGIVYLSETISKLYYQHPDKFKEEMISSKVSGNDNGFSFNQASAMDFNFYKNTYDGIGREIISPIANNAMSYYRYRLEGAFVDEYGNLVNKIKVLRKRDTDPTVAGYIYIIENLWSIHSINMWIDGKSLNVPVLDTLRLQQVYIPVKEPDVWMVFSRAVSFDISIFGISIDGIFTAIYQNYNLEPQVDKKFFNNEILVINEEANKKDTAYWQEVRPIPLTEQEIADYIKKDSLQKIWNSKEYMDSLDRKSNKFGWFDLISGYTFSNTYKKWSVSVNALSAVEFNTIQGFNPTLNTSFRKTLNEYSTRWVIPQASLSYGFADKQFRGNGQLEMNFNKTKFNYLKIEGGRSLVQFNDYEPVKAFQNTTASLFFKVNRAKFYDKYYGKVHYSQELFNGFYMKTSLEYARREPVFNNTDYSLFYKDKTYTSNHPLYLNIENIAPFSKHRALTLDMNIRIRFKQKYLTYPYRKFISGSRFPDLVIHYKRGIPIAGADTDFDFLSISLIDKTVPWGMRGTSKYNLEGGMFLTKNMVPFMDFHHFNGNELFMNFNIDYLDQFKMLPYYDHSTTAAYAKLQWEHHFEGYILGRIPGVRKLQWSLVIGSNVLYSEPTRLYQEVNIGLDRIGIGLFRIFRLDFVSQFQQGQKTNFGVLLGVDWVF